VAKKCFLICFLLVLATTAEASPQVSEEQAGSALNPLDYDSLGEFPTAPATYLFNTSAPVPTLIGRGVRIEGHCRGSRRGVYLRRRMGTSWNETRLWWFPAAGAPVASQRDGRGAHQRWQLRK
jgi:hypothetical protein